MDKCLVCCQPVGRKLSNSVETNVWEAALKVLRKGESGPFGDVSTFQKCHLCELCLNFANRSCELIRAIKVLQSELNDLGEKLRSFYETSIIVEEQVQESYINAENTVWVEARILLKACIGNAGTGTDQVIEVCPIWEEGPVYSPKEQVRDGVEKSNDDDEHELLHSSRIFDHESQESGGEEVKDAQKTTQFRTFTVQGFLLKDLEIRVERLTEDFVSKATRPSSRPRIAVSDAKSSDEDSNPDYNYASNQSAHNSSDDENADSGKIADEAKGRHRCALCGDRFDTYKLFLEHRKAKHPEGGTPLQCSVCGKTYQTEKSLKAHLYCHAKDLSCSTCGKGFYNEEELQRHKKGHSEGRQFGKPWCEICKLKFSTGTRLYEHRKSVHQDASQDGQFACDTCGKTFDNARYLKRHKRTHENGKYYCDLCNRCYPYLFRLKLHKKRVHPGGANSKTRTLECKACNNSFESWAALRDHNKTCSRSQDAGASHECSVCGKLFTSRTQLIQHVIWHQPPKISCDVCGKLFVQRSQLRKHLTTHTKEKLYTCEICGKHVNTLQRHLRRCLEKRASKEDKTFKCSHCDKSFLLQKSLSNHERSHSNETRFECDVCQKYLTTKSSLVQHRRRHFPQERLPCSMCSDTFIESRDLYWHKQYEHFGNRDKCSLCGYEPKTKKGFRMHMLSHRGDRPHECQVCGKKFKRRSHLTAHKKKIHKDSV